MKAMTSRRTRFTLFLGASLILPSMVLGETVLFEDTFDSAPADEQPTIPPWTIVNEGAEGENVVRVRQDWSEIFGKGTDNRYLEVIGNTGVTALWAENVLADGPDHEVVTFSFDFYEPEGAKSDPLVLFLYNGPVAGDARVERLRLVDGGTGASAPAPEDRVYPLGKRNELDWVVNNGAETVTYLNGGRELPPGQSDVWINGSLVLGGYTFESVEAAGPIRGFSIGTFSSTPAVETYFDDIRLIAGAQARQQQPLMEFLFEGGLVNTGSLGGEGTFVHERETDPDFNYVWENRASIGEGLGGEPNNGLDNTQVGGMGDYGQGTVREGGFFFPSEGLHNLQSVTIASWYKTPAGFPWSSNAFMTGWPNGMDFQHQTGTGTRVYLNVPEADGTKRQQFSFGTTIDGTLWQQFTERWTFTAVTFDGTTGTMSFYYGYEDSDGVIHNVTRSGMPTGPLRNLRFDVAFANNYFGFRPFKGHLDNVRVFGSTEDGLGALTQEHLEMIWASDLAGGASPDGPEVRIVDFSHDGTNFSVSFETDAGVTYHVESSTDLVGWEIIHTVVGDGSVESYSDPVGEADRRFYRVRAE